MVDRVIANPTEEPEAEQTLGDETSQAALAAAAAAGVTVNGEAIEAPAASEPAPAERPENVPEKFWDAEKGEVNLEALLASNAELEKQFTRERQQKDEKAEAPEEDADGVGDAGLAGVVETATAEFAETGELSEDTYEALTKAGLPKQMVDDFIAGQQARAESANQSAYAAAGGSRESYESMIGWAKDNLSEQEIAAFNAQVINPEVAEYAIQQLYAKFSTEADQESPLLGGDRAPAGDGSSFFANTFEMQKMMDSPEYKAGDATTHAKVRRMIAASEKRGIRLFG